MYLKSVLYNWAGGSEAVTVPNDPPRVSIIVTVLWLSATSVGIAVENLIGAEYVTLPEFGPLHATVTVLVPSPGAVANVQEYGNTVVPLATSAAPVPPVTM